MEEWKTIEFLDNKYSVSNLGRVKNNKTDKILKSREFKKTGYQRITLTINKKVFDFRIHRLVLLVFKPIDNPNEFQVDHIDFNRGNNHLDNLQWVDSSENNRKKRFHTKSYDTFFKLLLELGDERLNELLLKL